VGAFGGYMLPAGTPRPIVDRLAAEAAKALATTEARDRLAGIGMQPDPRSATAFAEYLKTHREQFRQVIEANNLRVE
jgi:tripartite-type tricarboxylate transporter receptor subunit TctC